MESLGKPWDAIGGCYGWLWVGIGSWGGDLGFRGYAGIWAGIGSNGEDRVAMGEPWEAGELQGRVGKRGMVWDGMVAVGSHSATLLLSSSEGKHGLVVVPCPSWAPVCCPSVGLLRPPSAHGLVWQSASWALAPTPL